jgi:hypothetical protein
VTQRPVVLALWLLFNGLLTYRVTRFIVKDSLTEPFRKWLRRTFTQDSSLVELFHCPWCVSVWVGALTLVPTMLWPAEWQWIALAGAICGFASLTWSWER